MYTLRTSASFDSAHFLKGYEGKCSNIHGHRWTVEIEVGEGSLQSEGAKRGMIVDFSELKSALARITDHLDHKLIIEKDSLKETTLAALISENFAIVSVDFRPTAENFARYFYAMLVKDGYRVIKATVYETPNNCAAYYE